MELFETNIIDILEYYEVDIRVLLHMLYDYKCGITGSIINYCFHPWEEFSSDLDIWIPYSAEIELQRVNIRSILSNYGYELTRTDISSESDPSQFSKLINIVEHYNLIKDGTTKTIDIVYLRKNDIEEVLSYTDIKMCMNYAKVDLVDGILKLKLESCDPKCLSDLIKGYISVNINFEHLNPYEANRKKMRFFKYLSRGYLCNPVIQSAYHELLEHFIHQYNYIHNYMVRQINGYGLSFRVINLIKEIKTLYETLDYVFEGVQLDSLERIVASIDETNVSIVSSESASSESASSESASAVSSSVVSLSVSSPSGASSSIVSTQLVKKKSKKNQKKN